MMTLSFSTQEKREVLDITSEIQSALDRESSLKDGICHLFLLHTTAALSTADLDPGTDLDYLDALEQMIPRLNYRHPHDPEHMPDHILSMLIGATLTLPFQDRKLVLGTWQRVVLIEGDGPRERKLNIHFI